MQSLNYWSWENAEEVWCILKCSSRQMYWLTLRPADIVKCGSKQMFWLTLRHADTVKCGSRQIFWLILRHADIVKCGSRQMYWLMLRHADTGKCGSRQMYWLTLRHADIVKPVSDELWLEGWAKKPVSTAAKKQNKQKTGFMLLNSYLKVYLFILPHVINALLLVLHVTSYLTNETWAETN